MADHKVDEHKTTEESNDCGVSVGCVVSWSVSRSRGQSAVHRPVSWSLGQLVGRYRLAGSLAGSMEF